MRKKLKSAIVIFAMALIWFAPTSKLAAQTVEKGNVIIDVYYGFPNLWTTFFRAIVNDNTNSYDYDNIKVGTFGPAGARAEYMVGEGIGIGLDFYYANSNVSYTDPYGGMDSLGNYIEYNYKISLPRPRLLLRGNFHFGNSEVADPYFALGLGYSGARFKYETNDPSADIGDYSFRRVVPVAYRLAFGSRFFFTDFLGASFEIGIGGPLMTGGLNVKF